MRSIALAAAVLALAGALVASVGAGTQVASKKIVGTNRSDHLKGTPGNDTILGLNGNDTLNGGKGNDTLIGGKGRDTYKCGPGKDTVIGDKQDVKPGPSCEVIKGIVSTPPPPPAPAAHPGHYSGTTGQGKSIQFDVSADSKTITNFAAFVDQTCQELPIPIDDVPVNLAGPFAVNSDGTFSTTFSYPAGSGIVNGSLSGSFDSAGVGTGTLSAEFDFYPLGSLTHCPSGNVSWTAQVQAVVAR